MPLKPAPPTPSWSDVRDLSGNGGAGIDGNADACFGQRRRIVHAVAMTGESLPVEAGSGSPVLAGYINGQGVLEVRTLSLIHI